MGEKIMEDLNIDSKNIENLKANLKELKKRNTYKLCASVLLLGVGCTAIGVNNFLGDSGIMTVVALACGAGAGVTFEEAVFMNREKELLEQKISTLEKTR